MKTFVIGHKNPDTDSIVSAIAYSKINADLIPAKAGKINKETAFLLDRFGFEVPENLPAEEKRVILVDNNGNPEELAENISEGEIAGVIDHHKLGGLKTAEPISVTIKTVGSTATIVNQLLDEKGTKADDKLAGLIIGAIVSDTLNLTSPTATEADKTAILELNKIALVDVDELAKEMFGAKSDISDIPTEELLKKDYKVFEMSGKKVGVGVWETVSPETVLARKEEIMEALRKIKVADGLDLIFFGVVDILNNSTQMVLISEKEKKTAEAAWNQKADSDVMELPGIVSRKKQMIPNLENTVR